ncbi:MAG: hypothetical protein CM1200mP41_00160 [Gammaproteobacteria bacterium]|nr:MAG: hypothetical protein CM1200mP41_00160 [Gammaproteobacteria bacterium]
MNHVINDRTEYPPAMKFWGDFDERRLNLSEQQAVAEAKR